MNGGKSWFAGVILAGMVGTLIPMTGTCAAPAALHVAAQGHDNQPGTTEAPLASLAGARDTLRRWRAEKPESLADGVTVWVHGGVYEMPGGVSFETQDGGAAGAPIVFRAAPGETPALLGGRTLPPEAFLAVTDPAILDRLDPAARDAVRCADLKALGVFEYGLFPDAYTTPPALPELFFNNERMTLARWPNNGEWAAIAGVVDSGPAPWRNFKSSGMGTFTCEGDRLQRWTKAPAVWLYGYWCFDWASETIRVKSVDPAARQITLATPHVYGIGSGNSGERRYCALNLLEELDAPGEYYLDRDAGRFYFWPPSAMEAGNAVLSLCTAPLVQLNDVSHVTFQGITLSCTAGDGLVVKGGENVCIEACTVRDTGLNGIGVMQGRNHRVTACDITENGTGGLVMEGGDRTTLTLCNHEAVDNHIWRVARRQRTHAYNVHLGGVGVRLANNLIHDAPHQAIGLGGNNHIIEYNEIHHICLESDDCGAFYMGRNPSERGSILRYNYWHDTGGPRSHGSCAVYFDDGAGGQTVFGNVFVRAAGGSFGAVFVHGGHDNRVVNNLFIDCKMAMRQVRWNDNLWKEWLHGELWQTRLLKEVDITKPPYSDSYPDLKGFLEFNGEPRMNHADKNVAVRCGGLIEGDWEQGDNWVTGDDPGFVDGAAGNFLLKPDSRVFSSVPGFEAIPFDKIGPRPNTSR